jgi:superfamily II DNA or RNA helicase
MSHIQQQRHALIQKLAEDTSRHLLLLTATPHSGKEDSFRSLLGLLKSEFCELEMKKLTAEERLLLAPHFVQRRRADVKRWLGEDTPFPERENEELHYQFSRLYQEFYDKIHRFAQGLVTSAETLTGWKKRMRFWAALALLRSITSSPAAAEMALRKRAENIAISLESDLGSTEEVDSLFAPAIYDMPENEVVVDGLPHNAFANEDGGIWNEAELKKVRDFAQIAQSLRGEEDTKLQKLITIVRKLLQDGYHSIVWCRYIATADYVAEELSRCLSGDFPDLKVVSITGALADEKRLLKIAELAEAPYRVLVATDCLSEGINLQEHFTAVVHYDLPWNPNRLEQREGRVDRFGQIAPKVKAVLLFGKDNPVDGAVLEVLLRKAKEIHRDLGIYVPVPANNESVLEAVLKSLFHRQAGTKQMVLFEEMDEAGELVQKVHQSWAETASREKESRTRFAQHAINPEEVGRELAESDQVLGSPQTVQHFLQSAAQRLCFGFRRHGEDINGKPLWQLTVHELPEPVRQRLLHVPDPWIIGFDAPTPQGVSYIGRNHILMESLAETILDMAFHPNADSVFPVSRCGVIRSHEVSQRTTLFLLRLRYLSHDLTGKTTLSEETCVWGFAGLLPTPEFLKEVDAQRLLDTREPTTNVPLAEKKEVLAETLSALPGLESFWQKLLQERRRLLEESSTRIRKLLRQQKLTIEPNFPPDVLGILVILPVPKGVKK